MTHTPSSLSSEELERMLLEIVLKKRPTLTTPEAHELRARLQTAVVGMPV